MVMVEQYISNGDSLNIYTQDYKPVRQVEAGIVIIHDLGDHCRRYSNICYYFANKNYEVIAFDLRGHGKSQGKRGGIKDISELFNDINLVVKQFFAKSRGIPLFLYGHGFGGSLALNYYMKYNRFINGIIVSSPWYNLIKNKNSYRF